MVRKIVLTHKNGTTFHIENTKFDDDVPNNVTITKCLALVNSTDDPDNYEISLIANNTILRVKPK